MKWLIPKKAYLLSTFFSRHYHKVMKLKCKARRYLLLLSCNYVTHITNYMNFKLSKDVEKNPGPSQYNTDHHEVIIRLLYAKSQLNNAVDLSYFLWEFNVQSRLGEPGLQSIDVSGPGRSFFWSVSHQLYGNSNHHMRIGTAGRRQKTLRVFFFVSDCELRQYSPPQKRGEECGRLTIPMQSRVPLGPGKFYLVVLALFNCSHLTVRFLLSRVLCYSVWSRFVTANTVVSLAALCWGFALCGLENVQFLQRDLLECFATFDYLNGNSFETAYAWVSWILADFGHNGHKWEYQRKVVLWRKFNFSFWSHFKTQTSSL